MNVGTGACSRLLLCLTDVQNCPCTLVKTQGKKVFRPPMGLSVHACIFAILGVGKSIRGLRKG